MLLLVCCCNNIFHDAEHHVQCQGPLELKLKGKLDRLDSGRAPATGGIAGAICGTKTAVDTVAL